MLMCYFVLRGICLLTFSYDAVQSFASPESITGGAPNCKFLVSGRDLACLQEVSLALTKTPPIHYYNVVDSTFGTYAG